MGGGRGVACHPGFWDNRGVALWMTLLAVALVAAPLWWVDRWLARDRVAHPDPPAPVRDPAAEHLALAAVFDRLGEPGLARAQRDLAVALVRGARR